MDRIQTLRSRRAKLLEAGSEIRAQIAAITDEKSFVESSSYSFSENYFYGDGAEGEGVVTGFATIEGNPVYIVAQNGKVYSGGVSKANCDKICKTLSAAYENGTPVVYFLDTKGVRIGEGVNVLEGIAEVLNAMNGLRGVAPQFSVVTGDCFGSFALIAAACDFTFITENACVSYASPSVIAATAKEPKTKADVGGAAANAFNGTADFVVGDLSEVKNIVCEILDILPATGVGIADAEDDPNRTSPALNEKVTSEGVLKAVFDGGKYIELCKDFAPDVSCLLGRIGGVSVGALMFNGEDKGVELDADIICKINGFLSVAADQGLTLVNFVNTKGICNCYSLSRSPVLKSLSNLIYNIKDLTKLSVIYGKAIGLGYSLFAAKSMGYDYSVAFAGAEISLFDSLQGAYVAYDGVRMDNEALFAEKYSEENQDPVNAAKGGYIDDIIEPQFVRQYLIAALQAIVR